MTKVINIYGGPGSGKSTLATELFTEFKRVGLDVELVTEYVKSWAWDGKQLNPYDQLYLLGKQSHNESRLYGKVDFIITDSPVMLCPFYEMRNQHTSMTLQAGLSFLNVAKTNGVQFYDFWLHRRVPYVHKGRYQTEAEADAMSFEMFTFFKDQGLKLIELPEKNPIDAIRKYVNV
jgi:hypothetical protein